MNDSLETPTRMGRMIFCSDEKLDAEITRLLGATVLELLRDPMVQEVSANYDRLTRACHLFADFGKGPMVTCDARWPINAAQRSFPELRVAERLSLSRGIIAALRRTQAQQRPELLDQGAPTNDPAAFGLYVG